MSKDNSNNSKSNSKSGNKKSKENNKEKSNKEEYFNDDAFKIVEEIKNKKFEYGIVIGIVFLIVLSIYFQYKYEKSLRMATGDDEDTNYYDILGVEFNADLPTIKKKYKELAKLWHPDKNPGCKSCHEKFSQIAKAYETLTDESRRGEYNNKSKSIFSSQPVFLTTKNYHKLVEESNDFWVICVYENTRTNNYNKFVADVFDEVHSKYRNIVKFGVIDVLHEENLLHFLPYKFQYFPNIFTYLHGEESELFGNFDLYSVKSLTQFIEDSFVSKAQFVDDSILKSLLEEKKNIDITDKYISFSDLEVSVFILSGKNYVDIVTKDFAKNYHNSLSIYQNDMSHFDKCLKLIKENGNYRIFIRFNEIIKENNKYYLKSQFQPIPVPFRSNIASLERLQKSFNIIKSMTLHKLYKNNYAKHCINKVVVNGEEMKEQSENETHINLCVILLEHNGDQHNKDINREFMNVLINNLKKHIEHEKNSDKKKKAQTEDYNIKINYATMVLESNQDLLNLYKKYHDEKSLNADANKNKKLFLIINDTNEKFMFKAFDNDVKLKEFFEDLDNSDHFEDLALSFDYFANYEIREIPQILNEEKIFSITKIIMSVVNSQMQATYVFSYILIGLVNHFILKKFATEKLLLFCLGLSLSFNLFLQLYLQLF